MDSFTKEELQSIVKALGLTKNRIMQRIRRYGLKCASGKQTELDTLMYNQRKVLIEELDKLIVKIERNLEAYDINQSTTL